MPTIATKTVFTLRDYLRIVFRRKKALLIPFAIGLIIAGPISLFIPPQYQSEALVRRQDLSIINAAPASLISRDAPPVSPGMLKTEMLTWTNLQRVINQLKLLGSNATATQWQEKYEALRKAITLETRAQSRGVDIVSIVVTYDSPALAEKIANAIAKNYIEESRKTSREKSGLSTEFLAAGEEESLAKLRAVEVELDKYRKENFAELPEVKKGILEQRQALHLQRTARKLQLNEAQNRLVEIEEQLKTVPQRISAPALETSEWAKGPGGLPASDQAKQETVLKQELDALLTNYTEEHPLVKALRKQLAALVEQKKTGEIAGDHMIINPAFQTIVSDSLSVQQEIKGCQAALRGLDVEIAAREDELRKIGNQEKRYTDLLRDQAEYEATHKQLRQNLLEARMTESARATSVYGTQVEMVAPGLEPVKPYRALRFKVAGALVFGGLVLGIATMFAKEYADPSLRSGHEAAAFLNVNVLGKISAIAEPEQIRRRRRRVWILASAVVILLAMCGAGLLLLESLAPETFEKLVATAASMAGRLKSIGSSISR